MFSVSGSRLVADAASRLGGVLAGVIENQATLDAIAAASRGQAATLAEVNHAVRQLDETTQHNAALVEQTNAAIEQTEAQASRLDDMVGVFALGQTAGGSSARRAA